MSRLRDNVERWLIHENYDFKQGKSDDATFKIIINNSDGLGTVSYTHLTLPTNREV